MGVNISHLEDHCLNCGESWEVVTFNYSIREVIHIYESTCKIRDECFKKLRFYIKKVKIELKYDHLEDKI